MQLTVGSICKGKGGHRKKCDGIKIKVGIKI